MHSVFSNAREQFPHTTISTIGSQTRENDRETKCSSPKCTRNRRIYDLNNLSIEWMRRNTFDTWPLEYIDKDELARSGFFYLCSEDLVQCFFCSGVVGLWERGDKPFEEHAKHFPNCPLVIEAPTSNVPLTSDNEEDRKLFQFLTEFLIESLENRPPSLPASRLETDAVSHGQRSIASHPYASEDNRIYSYMNSCPANLPPMEKLARAGFFYTGVSDFVMCYRCGGGLYNWRESDDPLKDHRSFYNHCPEVNPDPKEHKSSPQNVITEEQEDLLLNYSFSKKLIDAGILRSSVKGALKQYLQRHYYLPPSFQECGTVVLEWEDQQRKCPSSDINEVPDSEKEEQDGEEQISDQELPSKRQDFVHEGDATRKEESNSAQR